MDLVIEQYVQIINNQMEIVNPGQTLSPEDVDFLFRSMRDILKHDHPVRMVLSKYILDFDDLVLKMLKFVYSFFFQENVLRNT